MKNQSLYERISEIAVSCRNPLEILNAEITPRSPHDKLASILRGHDPAYDLGIIGLTVGDLIYDYMRLDPRVVEAADFARTEDLGDMFKFSSYADSLGDLPPGSFDGHVYSIKGYVAERFTAQELQSRGMEVEFPQEPNQPGYDLLVNGEPFQVKCSTDPDTVYEHFDRYPDIPVFVNEELAESLANTDNVYTVEGLNNSEVEAATRESMDAGADLLDYEVPLIAVSVALGRNAVRLARGTTDLKHGALNAAYDIAGGVAGGEAGAAGMALVGGVLGPYGVITGGIIGAVTGTIYGRRILSGAKTLIHTRSQEKEAHTALKQYIEAALSAVPRSKEVFENKTTGLLDALGAHGPEADYIKTYSELKIWQENYYLNKTTELLEKSGDDPLVLDCQTRDIIKASIEAISLSAQAKVHPHTVKDSFNKLISSLNSLEAKRKKL